MKYDKKEMLVEDMVAMLDSLTADGSGHIDVAVEEEAAGGTKKRVRTRKAVECRPGMACALPTLTEGLDGEAEKGEAEYEQKSAGR